MYHQDFSTKFMGENESIIKSVSVLFYTVPFLCRVNEKKIE